MFGQVGGQTPDHGMPSRQANAKFKQESVDLVAQAVLRTILRRASSASLSLSSLGGRLWRTSPDSIRFISRWRRAIFEHRLQGSPIRHSA